MRKRFKSRKLKRKSYLFVILFIFIGFLLYGFITSFLLKIRLTSSNEEFLKFLLNDSKYYLKYEKKENVFDKLLDMLYHMDLKEPLTILKSTLGFQAEVTYHVTSSDEILEPLESEYIEDPKPSNVENPRVYIYNTHQTEGYSYKKYEEYNITPNVMMSSYILREKLNHLGIPTLVETSNIKEILNANSWDYGSSYKASRFLVKDALAKYNSLDLIIDLHRDSIKKSASTTEIDGKKYAKVLFVVGKEHKNYQANLKLANALHEKIKAKYPSLARGVMVKSGPNVNGIYNQDLSSKSILLECGGHENTIEEVLNTLEVISQIIKEYLG